MPAVISNTKFDGILTFMFLLNYMNIGNSFKKNDDRRGLGESRPF